MYNLLALIMGPFRKCLLLVLFKKNKKKPKQIQAEFSIQVYECVL